MVILKNPGIGKIMESISLNIHTTQISIDRLKTKKTYKLQSNMKTKYRLILYKNLFGDVKEISM